MDKALIIIATCLALAGCTASARTGSLCSAGPILLDTGASDRLTRPEKEQIVTLNKSGETICGWRAP